MKLIHSPCTKIEICFCNKLNFIYLWSFKLWIGKVPLHSYWGIWVGPQIGPSGFVFDEDVKISINANTGVSCRLSIASFYRLGSAQSQETSHVKGRVLFTRVNHLLVEAWFDRSWPTWHARWKQETCHAVAS